MTGFRAHIGWLLTLTATGLLEPTIAKRKVGVLRLSSSAPVFIAQDKGYFKEAGSTRTEILRCGAADCGGDHLGRYRFRHHAFTGLYNLAGKGTLR